MDEKKSLGKIELHINVDDSVKHIHEALDQIKKLEPPSSDIADAIANIGNALTVAPFLGAAHTHAYQQAMEAQRQEDIRKLYEVGDGETSIVDDPMKGAYNRWRLGLDELQANITQFVKDWAPRLEQMKADSERERAAARQRSRDDLNAKRRDLRKRKGKL